MSQFILDYVIPFYILGFIISALYTVDNITTILKSEEYGDLSRRYRYGVFNISKKTYTDIKDAFYPAPSVSVPPLILVIALIMGSIWIKHFPAAMKDVRDYIKLRFDRKARLKYLKEAMAELNDMEKREKNTL